MAKSSKDDRELHAGLNKNRKCRDFIFIPFFALFWAGMFVVCATAIKNGAPYTLIVPKDYLGNYCGVNNSGNNSYADRTNFPYLYYINPFNLNGVNSTSICVASCPNVTELTGFGNSPCRYDISPTSVNELTEYVSYDVCAPYTYSSAPILQRCIPNQAIDAIYYNTTISANNTRVSVGSMIHSGIEDAQYAIADVYTTWPLLVVCCFTAIFISILWLYIAQYFVRIFVWSAIILINIISIAATIILYFYYNSRKVAYDNGTTASGVININSFGVSVNQTVGFLNTNTIITKNDVNLSLGIFLGVLISTVIIILVSIFMVKKVKIAIEVINEASMAFRSLPGIQFIPLIYSLLEGVLFTYFVIIALYIMSPTSSDISVSLLGQTFTSKNTSYYMMWYHVAGFLWTLFTLIGLSQLTVAGAVAEWYWTIDKSKKLGRLPVTQSAWRAIRYHLGSAIIGALLITIVELIRLFLYQLQKQVSSSKNPYLKYLVACAQCCMKCIEVILKWVNRHAYVYIAITGKAFFAAAGAATALLIRNAAKTFAVGFVADVVLFFTKLFIVGVNGIGAYAYLALNPNALKNGVFDPTITIVFVIVETYAVAGVFFSNYQLAIDTIFLSVLEDLDKNDGSPQRPYHMTERMKNFYMAKIGIEEGGKAGQTPFMAGKRRCRDIPFLVLFIAVWIVMIVIAQNAISTGNPKLLIVPQDEMGNYCGQNNTNLISSNNSYYDQTNNSYLYYFDPIQLQLSGYKCVAECPSKTVVLSSFSEAICKPGFNPTDAVTYARLVGNGSCAAYSYASSPILNRCTPIDSILSILAASNSSSSNPSSGSSVADIVTAGSSTTMQVLSGIVITWPVIVAGIGGSAIISLVWMGLLQFTAGVFVWITILITNVAFIFAAFWLYLFWQQSSAIVNGTTFGTNSTTSLLSAVGITNTAIATESTVQMLQIAFYAIAILAGLLLLVTIGMFKRIRMAVGVIKQASIAMMKMPLIVLFPLSIFALIAVLFIYFVWIMLYLITPTSSAAQTYSAGNYSWTSTNSSNIAIAIHVFGFLYTLFFLQGINQVTIAGAIGSWYWTMDKKAKMRFPVMKSLARTLRYHLGSIAAGALLIAIVEFIRVVLYQIQRKAQKSNLKVLQYIVACLQCCMKCVSVIVKFINRNAYIIVAITGKSFFSAAGHATALMVKNAVRLAAVDFVSSFVLFLSKIFVAGIAGIGSYIYLTSASGLYTGVVYPQVTVALVVLGSFMIGTAFFSVYEMAIDTIFLSFLEDLERNDGSATRPYYMPDALAHLMGVDNSVQKKAAVYNGASPSQITATAQVSPVQNTAPIKKTASKKGKVYNEF